MRLTQEDWQKERDKMLKTCGECHSANFARGELQKGDDMIEEADHMMAEAIRIVAGLYEDNILAKPDSYDYPFPDLLPSTMLRLPLSRGFLSCFSNTG